MDGQQQSAGGFQALVGAQEGHTWPERLTSKGSVVSWARPRGTARAASARLSGNGSSAACGGVPWGWGSSRSHYQHRWGTGWGHLRGWKQPPQGKPGRRVCLRTCACAKGVVKTQPFVLLGTCGFLSTRWQILKVALSLNFSP